MSEFLSVIEWFDESGTQLVQRIPPEGSGSIKLGSEVVVRDSQAAVFFRDGRGLDVLGPGRHALTTMNIPVLTKLLSLPYGFKSPFRAEVVFVDQKLFTNLGWGTQQPVAYRDAELGLVRLRAYGNYALRVAEPLLFVNRLVGTQGVFTTEEVTNYLRDLVLSRLTDYFGEHVRSLLDLPSQYTEMATAVKAVLADAFKGYGIELRDFFITAITPPEEVQHAIDQRGEMAAVGDMNQYLKFEAAQALGRAGTGTGDGAGQALAAGAGAGMGLMLPGMMWEAVRGAAPGAAPGATGTAAGAAPAAPPAAGAAGVAAVPQPAVPANAVGCPACHSPVPPNSRFCSHCGEALVAGHQCGKCGKRLPPDAQFCTSCGTPVAAAPVVCPECGATLPEGARFCSGCGQAIAGSPPAPPAPAAPAAPAAPPQADSPPAASGDGSASH